MRRPEAALIRPTSRLGRVAPGATPGRSLVFSRRRRRWRLPLAAVVVVVATIAVALHTTAGAASRPSATAPGRGTAAGGAAAPTGGRTDVGAGASAPAPEPTTPPLARLGDLELFLPAPEPVVVGFHEAATVSAIGVSPVGVLTEDRNTTRTDLPPDVAGGSAYLVLSSRGRSAGPTSAVDVVLDAGEPVRAPVTGTVLDVRRYLLYGAHEDLRIELVPDDAPEVRVVMIHVDGAAVEIGDRVVGGVTPVAATARRFPFSSHIDRETEPERLPHVHLEVQPIDAPRLGDDAEDAEDPADGAAGEPTGS